MLGFDPDIFWDQTIRTLSIAMHGKVRAARREYNQRVWLAWHIAALQRSKKLPKLKQMVAREKPRVQSWQEQLSIWRAYAGAHNAKLNKSGAE